MSRIKLVADMGRVRALTGDQLDLAETAQMVRPVFPYGDRAAWAFCFFTTPRATNVGTR